MSQSNGHPSNFARGVAIVPGYGLAVAQGQRLTREMADEIERRGGDVKYAIHPVAGRMPEHMNVLLTEANVRARARQRRWLRGHRERSLLQ